MQALSLAVHIPLVCFGIAFALEGISFFVDAIFMAIYVYGWQRLAPRAHFLCGVPIVLSGFAGCRRVHRGGRLRHGMAARAARRLRAHGARGATPGRSG